MASLNLHNRIETDVARTPRTALATYIDDYRVAIDAKLSPRTVICYQKALRELDVLLDHPCLAEFTLEAVERVVATKRKSSPSNARLIAAVSKAFSRWLHRKRHTTTHLLDTLGVPAFNGRRRAFSDAEFRAIRRALDVLPNRTRKRDRALVLFAMGSGLRSNELRTLDVEDLHIERPLTQSWALVRWETSKSKSSRQVRIAEDAAAAMHDYLASDRLDGPGPVFQTEAGRPFTYDGWGKMWSRIADAMESNGIKHFGAHRCRHQWATMGARTGQSQAEMCQEGGWERGSKVPSRYIDEIPFDEMQRRASPMSAFLRKAS